MSKLTVSVFLGFLSLSTTTAVTAWAQPSPYIGYAYPAGGQQGTTFAVKLGGQRLIGLEDVLVSGDGVTAEITDTFRKMNNQDRALLREQAQLLRQKQKRGSGETGTALSPTEKKILSNIESRLADYVARPASTSIAELVYVQVSIAPDAKPGPREIRVVTSRGISNPIIFPIGQIPEVTREPMRTTSMQVLGKEELALRNRPADEVEESIELPCTVNGQIASGEVNWYRFKAKQGQRLVISCFARQLIPYIADAVPGWFQAVMALYDENGNQVAYNDDFRFKPDPTIFIEVPADGEYRLCIHDAIYRGREDFVYRISIGELPTITSLFPLGGSLESVSKAELQGWNLKGAAVAPINPATQSPTVWVSAIVDGMASNRVPFAISTMNELFEVEPNNRTSQAQTIDLPTIVNGRIEQAGDMDLFAVEAKAGQTLVAEVTARRLDSPLDSMLEIRDTKGRLVAANDDHADVASGLNTHHADSYLMVKLPEDGVYYVQIRDTSQSGGKAFAYRLRLSPPCPDFELRAEPSGLALRSGKAMGVNVYAIRKDGFDGDIQIRLNDSVKRFSASSPGMKKAADSTKIWIKSLRNAKDSPSEILIEGIAEIDGQQVVRRAVACEDKMQAFLWRHLVPTEAGFSAIVFGPKEEPEFQRPLPPRPSKLDYQKARSGDVPQFTAKQVQGRLRQLRLLFEEWSITDSFYNAKVAQCETFQ
ncbi:putative subtilase-type serine protease precursor [Novipirellula aureliae]|uniref:Putative subtilase-type serine protease n=1 Tax=Novipirellula aureliae TaxID=2527966 RepID=A0A5C6EBI0_9BACT|nr:PPC domain-containing protein [Novipirellula aureliae]TWU44866.1 putative subtilase-type serine protease precursor [Novipirellula aureliae]